MGLGRSRGEKKKPRIAPELFRQVHSVPSLAARRRAAVPLGDEGALTLVRRADRSAIRRLDDPLERR